MLDSVNQTCHKYSDPYDCAGLNILVSDPIQATMPSMSLSDS